MCIMSWSILAGTLTHVISASILQEVLEFIVADDILGVFSPYTEEAER